MPFKNSLFECRTDRSREGKDPSRERTAPPDPRWTCPQKETSTEPTDEQLLEVYLDLPKKERENRFADTAHAAEMVGLSQRTIQLWIEIGLIRAILLGGKYMICLNSLKDYLKSRIEQQGA
jgi:excisionase family DNA binding protein